MLAVQICQNGILVLFIHTHSHDLHKSYSYIDLFMKGIVIYKKFIYCLEAF